MKNRRSAQLALCLALFAAGACSRGGSNPDGPGGPSGPTPPGRATVAATLTNVSGARTSNGYVYTFQTNLQDTGNTASTITSFVMTFLDGENAIFTVDGLPQLPSAQLAANGTVPRNWTIADDVAGRPFATRIQVAVAYSDATGPLSASAVADVPALAPPPERFTLCGTVREQDAGPLVGVLVEIKATTRNVLTDAAGGFCFDGVENGHLTLQATLVGFSPKEQDVEVSGNTIADVAMVKVVTPPPSGDLPTIVSFTADKTTINLGESTVLWWSLSFAESGAIDNGIGPISSNGSYTVTPKQTTTYRLTATNASGSVNQTVTVTVVTP